MSPTLLCILNHFRAPELLPIPISREFVLKTAFQLKRKALGACAVAIAGQESAMERESTLRAVNKARHSVNTFCREVQSGSCEWLKPVRKKGVPPFAGVLMKPSLHTVAFVPDWKTGCRVYSQHPAKPNLSTHVSSTTYVLFLGNVPRLRGSIPHTTPPKK